MGLFAWVKGLFRKKSNWNEQMNPQAITALFNAQTGSEELRTLTKYPELLNDLHTAVFQKMSSEENPQEEMRSLAKAKYNVLISARQSKSPDRLDLLTIDTKKLAEDLCAFLETKTWAETVSFLEQHPILYSQDDRIESLYDAMEKQNDIRMIKHIAILRRCRQKGIKRAIQDEIDVFGNEKLDAAKVLLRLIGAKNRDEAKHILLISPELIKGDLQSALTNMKSMMGTVSGEASRQVIKRIECLEQCRREGIEKGLKSFI